MFDPSAVSNLANLLRVRAEREPQMKLYTWLRDGEREAGTLSCMDLDRRAQAIAARLQSSALKRKRALLLYPPGLDFIQALLGCFYAGVVAVPLPMPRPNRDTRKLAAVLRDADCEITLITQGSSEAVSNAISLIKPQMVCIATDAIPDDEREGWKSQLGDGKEVAYLQYTSGSTSLHKGVMVTHANVLANVRYFAVEGDFHDASLSVSWLPHFHDMGLIYGLFQPLFSGFRAVLFSPIAFTQRPLLWLKAISDYRGTHSGGPNFA